MHMVEAHLRFWERATHAYGMIWKMIYRLHVTTIYASMQEDTSCIQHVRNAIPSACGHIPRRVDRIFSYSYKDFTL